MKLEKVRRKGTTVHVAWQTGDGRGGWRSASVEEALRAANRGEKVRYSAAHDVGGKPSVSQGVIDPRRIRRDNEADVGALLRGELRYR